MVSISKIISTVDVGGAADLLCPRCGADNLWHDEVTIFDRAEDAKELRRTWTDGSSFRSEVIPAANSGNPSGRRHGLKIAFSCELCGGGLTLTIGQHKGSTEIGWIIDGGKHEATPYERDPEFGKF